MKIKFVKDEHARLLLEYLDAPGVVLLFPSAREEAARLGIEDGDDVPDDYDFGGEADVWVDLVTHPNHYLLIHMDPDEKATDGAIPKEEQCPSSP